jgi:hypothetical protein
MLTGSGDALAGTRRREVVDEHEVVHRDRMLRREGGLDLAPQGLDGRRSAVGEVRAAGTREGQRPDVGAPDAAGAFPREAQRLVAAALRSEKAPDDRCVPLQDVPKCGEVVRAIVGERVDELYVWMVGRSGDIVAARAAAPVLPCAVRLRLRAVPAVAGVTRRRRGRRRRGRRRGVDVADDGDRLSLKEDRGEKVLVPGAGVRCSGRLDERQCQRGGRCGAEQREDDRQPRGGSSCPARHRSALPAVPR